MKKPERLKPKLALAVALAAAVLAGCATAPPSTKEQTVANLAAKRWDALRAGKFEDAYAMLSPSQRAVTPFQRWRGKFGGAAGWSDVEVVSVTCETDSACTARMLVSVVMPALTRNNKPLTAPVNETWVEEEGRWWLLDKM